MCNEIEKFVKNTINENPLSDSISIRIDRAGTIEVCVSEQGCEYSFKKRVGYNINDYKKSIDTFKLEVISWLSRSSDPQYFNRSDGNCMPIYSAKELRCMNQENTPKSDTYYTPST